MEAFNFDGPLEAAPELEALLTENGVAFRRTGSRFRFQFAAQGCRWQTVCDCMGSRALIYGIHPTPVRDRAAALECCSRLTGKAVQGGCFLAQERLVFRTEAELFEPCAARESLLRALEYNAAFMTAFWREMAAGASGTQI